MVYMVIFINLFFIPLLPLYLIYRKKQKSLEPDLDLLFQYGIITACNVPLTKVPIFLIKKIAGIFIPIDSGYYTIAALFPTILIILLYIICKFYPDHSTWKEKIIQKGVNGVIRDLAPACILFFVSCFMLLIFEPILMYATNINDFWFDFQLMIGPVLSIFVRVFLIGIVIIFAIYNADLLLSNKLLLYKGITLIGFILFILIYLQGNWLAGNLPALTGEEIAWREYGKSENFILISATCILTVALVISIKKRGLDRTVFYGASCTLTIFVMLFVALISTVVADKALDSKDTFSPTLKNYNTISSNKNFLIFLVDSVNSTVCYDVMMEDDDFLEMMEDFTYYPDAMSVYPQTRDSIPAILTGSVYYNETNFTDFSTNAYNQSPFFEKLTQYSYGINLYSNAITWKGTRKYNIENVASIYDSSIDLNDFMEQEFKYIKFRYLPYSLKQLSKIETLDFETCRITNSEYVRYPKANKKNYEHITENSILDKQSQNYFQFIHCDGSHAPYNLDKDLNIIEGGTEKQKTAASLTLIKAYLQRLKDNDAYDNSVIVIMSDHGFPSGNEPEQPYKNLDRLNPILFIKGINEKHEMLESDRSVSYMNLQDAFSDLLDGKQSTELFTELEPGRKRTVIWQVINKENHKVEYETTGSARDPRKFTPTGNVYDLVQ